MLGPILALVLPDSAPLHDPEFTLDVVVPQSGDQSLAGVDDIVVGRTVRQPQNRYAGVIRRIEDKWIPEVQIECHQAAPFRSACGDYVAIAAAGQPLFEDGLDIVACRPQDADGRFSEILI